MAPKVDDAKHELNRRLYDALLKGEEDKVNELCHTIPEGPLHVLTIHGDTVLHMATYSKQKNLVFNLLGMLPEQYFGGLMHKNDVGNTILHEAATSDRIVPAAEKMLRLAPDLLSARNHRGETALFRAARYGKKTMFEFLDKEVNKKTELSASDLRALRRREDMTTILHMSILAEHFDLALLIAKKYEYLVDERDEDCMTALQLLSCNASAFRSGIKGNSLKQLLYSCMALEPFLLCSEIDTGFKVPLWEAIRAEKQRYESARQLADFLIGKDTSWEATESAMDESKPKTHKYGRVSTVLQNQDHEGSRKKAPTSDESGTEDTLSFKEPEKSQETINEKVAETPLILATKSGCTEIVEEILRKYPQAVEHVDAEGRNILHVAIKYRQIKVFDIVERMGIPMTRLIRKIDDNGNSILHYVGIKAEDHGAEDMRSPAMLLQEDLLLFERVQKVSTTHFIKHFNCNRKTAEELFADSNAQIRENAKEWLKRTAENCSIVAVLIATVAFAAAYTVPGGPNQNTGYPILVNKPFFIIFTMTDVLSLTFALTSVITFLSILTSPFRLKDFKQSLPQKLMLGVTFLIFSVSMMMLAFAATVILLIRDREQWTKIALYSVAFFPVTIFALSYMPLYMSLIKTLEYSLKKIWAIFPRSESGLPHRSWTFKPFKVRKSHARNATSSTYPSTLKTTRYPVPPWKKR
ncbi:hypothetical protein RJ639_003091 [Escallonia herrerae]|uniref:PGG domain-containing protein n=1 Tax=Escallonia herrerae TaxID=1293975 RepID=A0AA88W6B6_9ASTE|nr:hypothetical protein RJ639_003091 [Escallonia herrerae]